MTVYASYLSDYALEKIYAEPTSTFGSSAKTVRGAGWTIDNEARLQDWIRVQMAKEGQDKWIAETASAKVGAMDCSTSSSRARMAPHGTIQALCL